MQYQRGAKRHGGSLGENISYGWRINLWRHRLLAKAISAAAGSASNPASCSSICWRSGCKTSGLRLWRGETAATQAGGVMRRRAAGTASFSLEMAQWRDGYYWPHSAAAPSGGGGYRQIGAASVGGWHLPAREKCCGGEARRQSASLG